MSDFLKERRVVLKDGATLYSEETISTPEKASRVIGEQLLSSMAQECVAVVNLDNRLRPISFHLASVGTINQAVIDVPTIFKSALLENAASVMLLHNHPSGDPSPSEEDLKATARVKEAGELLGVRLVDHVIVGAGVPAKYFSIAEHGWPGSTGEIASSVFERGAKYVSTRDQVKEATDRLIEGVKEFYDSEKYRKFLSVMSRFYRYSANNCLLIALQNPKATLVAGYRAWQDKFHRQVRKGETAIKILQPAEYKEVREVELINERGEAILDEQGQPRTKQLEIPRIGFRIGSVFDVSQTDGEPLPEIASKLTGDFDEFKTVIAALRSISPVSIRFADTGSAANGYYSESNHEIVVSQNLMPEMAIKTAIHEVAHARIHQVGGEEREADRETKEVQAESVAFIVCQHFGIRSDDYSFGYVAGWSNGRDGKELLKSLDVIQKTAAKMIDELDMKLMLGDSESVAEKASRKITSGVHMPL